MQRIATRPRASGRRSAMFMHAQGVRARWFPQLRRSWSRIARYAARRARHGSATTWPRWRTTAPVHTAGSARAQHVLRLSSDQKEGFHIGSRAGVASALPRPGTGRARASTGPAAAPAGASRRRTAERPPLQDARSARRRALVTARRPPPVIQAIESRAARDPHAMAQRMANSGLTAPSPISSGRLAASLTGFRDAGRGLPSS